MDPIARVELLEHDLDSAERQWEARAAELRADVRSEIAGVRADIKGMQRILIGLLITMVGTLFAALTALTF